MYWNYNHSFNHSNYKLLLRLKKELNLKTAPIKKRVRGRIKKFGSSSVSIILIEASITSIPAHYYQISFLHPFFYFRNYFDHFCCCCCWPTLLSSYFAGSLKNEAARVAEPSVVAVMSKGWMKLYQMGTGLWFILGFIIFLNQNCTRNHKKTHSLEVLISLECIVIWDTITVVDD